jgi:hypothetical protein
MLNSIDKHIEDQKRKILFNSKNIHQTQKTSAFNLSMTTLPTKENNFMQPNDYT